MGGKNSAQIFESSFQLFSIGLYFNFPTLFYTEEEKAWRKLFSWLDDVVNAASAMKYREAWELALQAYVVIRWAARFVGIMLAPDKSQPPSQLQEVLGLQVHTLTKRVLLKENKAAEYATTIRLLLNGRFTKLNLESVHGKLNHAAYVAPVIRALLPPLTEAYSQDHISRPLRHEVRSVLNIVIPILTVNPATSFFRFRNAFKIHLPTSYTDASGFESSKFKPNPFPGGLAGLTPRLSRSPWAKKHQTSDAFWFTSWPQMVIDSGFKDDLEKHLTHKDFPSTLKSASPDEPPIAYLEFLAVITHLLVLVRVYGRQIKGKFVIFMCDSIVSLCWLSSSRIKRYPWYRLSPILPLLEQVLNCRIIIRWTPSENQLADAASRGSRFLRLEGRLLKAQPLPKRISATVLGLLVSRKALTELPMWKKLLTSSTNPDFKHILKVFPPLTPPSVLYRPPRSLCKTPKCVSFKVRTLSN